jgi:hypothetical protein
MCRVHGAPRKRCISHEGCTNIAKKGGVCVTHGAKVKAYKRCSFKGGCTKKARKGGVCQRHYSNLTYGATMGDPYGHPSHEVTSLRIFGSRKSWAQRWNGLNE